MPTLENLIEYHFFHQIKTTEKTRHKVNMNRKKEGLQAEIENNKFQ